MNFDEKAEEIYNKTDYETRLAITRYVMKKICEHASQGGTYRYLIYDRLGFGIDAYGYLCPYGMTISNYFEIPKGEENQD